MSFQMKSLSMCICLKNNINKVDRSKYPHLIKMSHHIKNNAHLLKVLAECSPKLRKSILQKANAGLLRSLCECSLNVLKGNVKLNSHQKRKLSRHKRKLRTLADHKIPNSRKKQLLVQQGGFVGALLGPVLSTLAGLLFK